MAGETRADEIEQAPRSTPAEEELLRRRQRAREGGGPDRVAAQHARGKLTARERLDLLLDRGSFEELDAFVVHRGQDFGMSEKRVPGDAVVTGFGTIAGRLVFVSSQDFTVFGGSLSSAAGAKICKVLDLALKAGAPVVALNDSGGARIQEGVESLRGYGDIFLRNTRCSGVVPQISAILGPCAGGAVYSPAITDFVAMVADTSCMYLTGPSVVKAVTLEEVSHQALGGAEIHSKSSGVAHFVRPDDPSCLRLIRELLSYLPQNNAEDPPTRAFDEGSRPPGLDCELGGVVPSDPTKPYDMLEVVRRVVDPASFLEVLADYARNVVIGFARIAGHVVGVVGNQPNHLSGVLDIHGSVKAARFIRFCDCFNIPIVTFVDLPGFMPGTDQEVGGIIRCGAKLAYAYAEATVPKLTVITRKAYGGGYIVMSSKHVGGDLNLAWPSAEIAVMGSKGAIEVIFRDEIDRSPDKEAAAARCMREYEQKLLNPYAAAEAGYVDAVILPSESRARLIHGLKCLRTKRDKNPFRKHGNIPL